MLEDAFERGGGEAVSAFLAPRDPVLTFLERYVDNPGRPVSDAEAETIAALIESRRIELGEAAVGAPADTPMNQRSVLFNDLSAAPVPKGRWWLLSDRMKVAGYLHEKGWRRRLTPDDVR